MKLAPALKGALQALLLHLGVSLEKKRLLQVEPLARGVPRLNIQGDSREGDKYGIDCAHCRTRMWWTGEGFECEVCGNTMTTRQASEAFFGAAVTFLDVSQQLEDIALTTDAARVEPPPKGQDDGNR